MLFIGFAGTGLFGYDNIMAVYVFYGVCGGADVGIGSKNYPLNLSIANFAIVFGSLLNIVVQAAVGGSENRLGVFMALLVMAIIALVDVFPFSKMRNSDIKKLDERRAQQQ